jgi:hypothetical protein
MLVKHGYGAAALTVLANEPSPPSLRSEVGKIDATAVFFIHDERGQGGTETAPNRDFYRAGRVLSTRGRPGSRGDAMRSWPGETLGLPKSPA